MFNIIEEELTCPITLSILENPIQLSCCGKMISKEPFKTYWIVDKKCPLCKKELLNINIDEIPINKNIMNILEIFQKKDKSTNSFENKVNDFVNDKNNIYVSDDSKKTENIFRTNLEEENIYK